MKKILLGLVLAVCMVFASSTVAMAAELEIVEPYFLDFDKDGGAPTDIIGPSIAIWGTNGTSIVSITGPSVSIWGTNGTSVTAQIVTR